MNATEKLHECLLEEDALVVEFTELLGSETVALTERQSFNALNAITESKNGIAVRLHELSARRDALLAELGYGPGARRHYGSGATLSGHRGDLAPAAGPVRGRGRHQRPQWRADRHAPALYRGSAGRAAVLTKRSSLYEPNGRSRQGNTGKTIIAS